MDNNEEQYAIKDGNLYLNSRLIGAIIGTKDGVTYVRISANEIWQAKIA